MPPIYTTFLYLISYSFLGWICESTYKSIFQKKVVNSGFLNGPVCPIYGFGAILIVLFLTPIKPYPILVFILGIISISIIEYFTSWVMEIAFHMRWWDYSKQKYNINGSICLLNSFLFGCMSICVLYYIHPIVKYLFEHFSTNLQIVFSFILLFLVCIDFIISTYETLTLNHSLQKIQTLLHNLFETDIKPLNQNILKENEIIIRKLIHKKESLNKAFPTLKHNHWDVSSTTLYEIKEKIQNLVDDLKK